MVIPSIDPFSVAQVGGSTGAPAAGRGMFTGNPFDDFLSKAVDALENVSNIELHANDLIESYLKGEAEISDVLVATSKANIAIQLAVTTITTAVSTFKEITQMAI